MSEIAGLVGDNARRDNYSSIASSYVEQFQKLATSGDGKHLTLAYGNDSSWGLTYNLYSDKLLGTNIFPQSVIDLQTSWYGNVTMPEFGLPLDTRHDYVLSGWEIWTAAFVNSATLRNDLVGAVLRYAGDGKSGAPFQDWYNTTDGTSEPFAARPVVGSHLALLALPGFVAGNASATTTTVPLANPTSVPPGQPPAPSITTTVTGSAASSPSPSTSGATRLTFDVVAMGMVGLGLGWLL